MTRLLLASVCALTLSACATDRPLSYSCAGFMDFAKPIPVTAGGEPTDAIRQYSDLEQLIGEVVAGYENRIAIEGNRIDGQTARGPQFLVLSGGGQWGAFGAGLIQRWPTSGENQRPVFDMVTGISTGALQATYAFLGREADAGLIEAYTIAREDELVERHGDLFFLGNASMADTGPLDRNIRERLPSLLDQVAAAGRDQRRLLVGVVDAIDGKAYAIDMTRIASELEGRERLDCYAGALLASAAVPVVFRQVQVEGRPYFDGGVRHSVFVTEVEEASARMVEAANEANVARGSQERMTGTMYIVFNGDPVLPPDDDVRPKLLPVLNRTRQIAFNQIELNGIYNTAETLPDMRTRVATAHGHGCEDSMTDPEMIFDPSFMQCLIGFGQQSWADGNNPWTDFPTDEN